MQPLPQQGSTLLFFQAMDDKVEAGQFAGDAADGLTWAGAATVHDRVSLFAVVAVTLTVDGDWPVSTA